MKFTKKYPTYFLDEFNFPRILYEGTELIYSGTKGFCAVCNTLTNWVDINFECFLCSEECETEYWIGYFKASSDGQSYEIN